jgi:hypothetical protein
VLELLHVSVRLMFTAGWTRYAAGQWVSPAMEAQWNVERARQRLERRGLRSGQLCRLPLAPAVKTPAVRVVHRFFLSLYDRRPYLAECNSFRSSRRGRGREYQAPWWRTHHAEGVEQPVLSDDMLAALESRAAQLAHSLASGVKISSSGSEPCASPPPVCGEQWNAVGADMRIPAMVCQMTAYSSEARCLSMGMLDTGANLCLSRTRTSR